MILHFAYQISSRFSSQHPTIPNVIEGKHLVETWGKVLLTTRYIDSDENLGKYNTKMALKITFEVYAVTSLRPLKGFIGMYTDV